MQKTDTVLMAHGSGGTMMRDIIEQLFFEAYASDTLRRGDDAAVLDVPAGRIAFSTDTFVVTPHFFPGGDIGHLAVCGTVNDVATSGATPRYLSCGFVLEEGYPLDDLRRVCASMAATAKEAGVEIVTGDTKVVNRGALSIGAIFLILCGLIPKLGAIVSIMPQSVLGGAAVMMFSSIVISGIQLITKEEMTPRNLTIVSVALGVGYGMGANMSILAQAPQAIQLIFGGSGIVPAAFVAIILNILLPKDK